MTPAVSRRVLGEYVNLAPDDERYNLILSMMAESATQLAENYLGQRLEKVPRVEFFPSQASDSTMGLGDTQTLWVDAFPIDPVGFTLSYSATLKWDFAIPLIEGMEFLIEAQKGLVHIYPNLLKYALVDHPQGFRLTHSSGYEIVEAAGWAYMKTPTPITTAVALQAAFFFSSYSRGSMGLDTAGGDKSTGGKSKPAKMDLDALGLIPEARTILRSLRRPLRQLGDRR